LPGIGGGDIHNAELAVIGGTGFYQMDGLSDLEEVELDTPFGAPSDSIVLGTLGDVRVAFLPRHGKGHRILPSELPALANIWALKRLGVERIIAVSAVGSLREEIEPLHFVVPDQLIDRTRGRPSTFFGRGLVAHVAFDQPFCAELSGLLVSSAEQAGATVHKGGTCVVIDGPAFSTKSESHLYQSWGADIIGMTAIPEAKLAREAELCYASVSMVTDYDCWHDDHDAVEVSNILEVLTNNADRGRSLVAALAAPLAARPTPCPAGCDRALDGALITAPEARDPEVIARLDAVAGRVL